jgi:hypothetical protein
MDIFSDTLNLPEICLLPIKKNIIFSLLEYSNKKKKKIYVAQ